MVAEGWARRRYKAVFVSKLDEAFGEGAETQSITRMLSRMIDRADDFCKYSPATDYRFMPPRVEEEITIYEAPPKLDEFFVLSP